MSRFGGNSSRSDEDRIRAKVTVGGLTAGAGLGATGLGVRARGGSQQRAAARAQSRDARRLGRLENTRRAVDARLPKVNTALRRSASVKDKARPQAQRDAKVFMDRLRGDANPRAVPGASNAYNTNVKRRYRDAGRNQAKRAWLGADAREKAATQAKNRLVGERASVMEEMGRLQRRAPKHQALAAAGAKNRRVGAGLAAAGAGVSLATLAGRNRVARDWAAPATRSEPQRAVKSPAKRAPQVMDRKPKVRNVTEDQLTDAQRAKLAGAVQDRGWSEDPTRERHIRSRHMQGRWS